MTDSEYKTTQNILISQTRILATLDIEGFIERTCINPILDPTMTPRDICNLSQILRLAKAARKLVIVFMDTVTEREEER